jgi:hypothetical protein
LVARRPELLQPEVADVWVRLWDGVERVGGWSKPSWFDDVAAKIGPWRYARLDRLLR